MTDTKWFKNTDTGRSWLIDCNVPVLNFFGFFKKSVQTYFDSTIAEIYR
jgi:hypothetical protein